MSNDKEYDDLVRCEQLAEIVFRKAHYHIIDTPRCSTCAAFIPRTYREDEDLCGDAMPSDGRWLVGEVSPDGVCDNWRPKKD